ncbi:MAG: hypothetical protein JNM89_10595 [Hyphomicrobiaceae bacterium]|nr:hypothetical protein [Hyphomicrobiaceae bacterium]
MKTVDLEIHSQERGHRASPLGAVFVPRRVFSFGAERGASAHVYQSGTAHHLTLSDAFDPSFTFFAEDAAVWGASMKLRRNGNAA